MCVCEGGCVSVHVHVCNGILLSHKKNETVPFSAADITLSEVSQENDKYHMISICEI